MLIDGKEVKNKKIEELKEIIKGLNTQLGLAVIQVGDDEASIVYIRQKEKLATELGYKFIHKKYDSDVKEEVILDEIDKLNNDKSIHGILVQMPLPKHLDENKIQNRISHLKDVDGLTYINAGKLVNNEKGLVPCTPKGIIDLLDYYKIPIEGANAVVVGRSILVGKPIANMLLNRNATVTICHSRTKDLEKITKKADILVVAIGKKWFINSDMIKKGSTIIDVGINRCDGKLYGDVYFDNVKDKCKYITPVPGGVGPMTVTELMYNVLNAYYLQK
jgi:methylenetetrahydrofolate dehydrogenase (NADP+)/methenyltetrahydrofolate cyclohydrolase